MQNYVKLFDSLIDSTVWQECHTTRILWITLLVKKDKDGNVWASLPGIAHAARISLDECKAGIETLSAPDPYSRSNGEDGRRINPIEGGWHIINHGKYRDALGRDAKREADRLRQARYRLRKGGGSLAERLDIQSGNDGVGKSDS